MRKIIVISMMSLDGVVQAPGGPGEDRSGGFRYGGWVAPYTGDAFGRIMARQMTPADLLLGRKTYDIFASYWPKHAEGWPGINDVAKYVVSRSRKNAAWNNSTVLRSVADIRALKRTKGGDLKVWGSSVLVQTLLKHGLADELWLNIFPLTLGKGKRFFGTGTVPVSFTMMKKEVTAGGIIAVRYVRGGKVKTGTVGEA